MITNLLDLQSLINSSLEAHPVSRLRREPYLRALNDGVDRLIKPTMVTWNVTRFCNLRCTYCAPDALFGKPLQTDENRRKILDSIVALDPVFVSLLGGEPTLIPEITSLIHALIKNGIHADLTTNGARVNDAFCESLSFADPDKYSLMLSLDSHDAEINDSQRGQGCFNTSIRAARRMASCNLPFAIGMTITGKNLHHLASNYKLADELGARYFCAWFVMPCGRANKEQVTSPDSEFVRQVEEIIGYANNGGPRLSRLDLSYSSMRDIRKSVEAGYLLPEVTEEQSEAASMVGCEGCRYRVLIDENGDVYPCDFLQYREFLMGNILTDSWDEIWWSAAAKLKSRLKRSTKPGCQSCVVTLCDTGCFGVTYAEFKRSGRILPMCEV